MERVCGAHLRVIAPRQRSSFRNVAGGQAADNTVSDLTSLRFEPKTSCSRDERVTARPTGRSKLSTGMFHSI